MQGCFLRLCLLARVVLVLGLGVFVVLLLLYIAELLVWLPGFLVFVLRIRLLCKLVLQSQVAVEFQAFFEKFLLLLREFH